MPLEIAPIHPPVPYPLVWAAPAAGLVLLSILIAALGLWRWRALAPTPLRVDDSLERCRLEALTAIEGAERHPDAREACQRISRATRRFVGLASDSDADYSSLRRLRRAADDDPRLLPVATFVADTRDACFDPAADPDVAEVARAARRVVLSWR